MKSGFSHFDGSGRENFCAAVLVLTMEVDDAVKELVARLVRQELSIDAHHELLAFGREARLEADGDGGYARVDIWLLFGPPAEAFYAFVEVKTHERWDAVHVAHQVQDQAERRVTRSGSRRVHGSILLGPERLCARVKTVDSLVRFIIWPRLFAELRALRSASPLTDLAVRHLEEKMDRPPGLDRPMSLDQFEQATTTVACLREFLVDCVDDIGGRIKGEPIYLTPGDGQPRSGGGWAWHGLSVPFSRDQQTGRVGIYKYSAAPPGEELALEALWLEAYVGDADVPIAYVKFAPSTLSAAELDTVRADLKRELSARASARSAELAT
jgi:hypothetical protein